MKLNMKSTARLAVSAGLCASLVMGGMPLSAIAEELDVEKIGQVEAPADEQAPADAADEAPAQEASAADEAPAPAADEAPAPATDGAKPEADGAKPAADEAAGLAGKGTAEDPYQVSSVEELQLVANKVNAGEGNYGKAHYKLIADIDLADVNWTPIGTSAHKFSGTFDGAGHTVSNLAVNNTELEGAGLFGWLENGKISGIKLNNATVTAKSSAGALVGVAHTGAIGNCHVAGVIKITAHYKVGGLAGGGYASIANCSVNAAGDSFVTGVFKQGDLEGDNVGGLVGFRGEGATATTGCSVSGLKVSGTRKVGGLIGSAFADNKVEGCSVSNVELACNAPYDYAKLVKNQLCVGGLIGIFHKSGSNGGTMKDCSVSSISMSVTVPEVAKEGWPILGLVSGGYRASSLSGASAPDGQVNIEGLKVEGTNTGSNAEEKFPGSVAMNGTSSVFEKGSGTAEDPYIISSVDDLKLLQKTVNSTGITYEGQYLKLADGVEFDLSGEKWTSIGTSRHKFMGTFDGNGATIKGLSNPLFGGVEDVTIENVTLDGVDIREETVTDYRVENYGALVSGDLKGTCVIRGVEVAGSVSGFDYIGGIFGGRGTMDADDSLLVEGCVNRATVTSRGKTGGIAGYVLNRKPLDNGSVTVKNCKNEGAITGEYAGGIAGMTVRTTYEGCENSGAVSGTETAGGIIGTANSGTSVTSCKNSAEVVCDKASGGIVGSSSSGGNEVVQSANTGNVTGVTNAGGIIGGSGAQGDTVVNCYNGGAIAATGDGAIAAGIYGYNNSTSPVKACFNDGAVKADKGTAYQIGKSTYWYEPAPGSQNASCFYKDGDKIFAAAKNGTDDGVEQKDMTRGDLAEVLNEAGGVENFWQAQNGSVQPDPLIPGAMDDKERLVAQVFDAEGNLVEGYDSLADAVMAAKDGQTVKLVKNVEITEMIKVSEKNIVLDLGGFKITQTSNAFAIVSMSGAELTLKNGVVSSKGTTNALYAQQASITTIDLTVNARSCIQVGNHQSKGVYWGELTLGKGTVLNAGLTAVTVVGPYDAGAVPAEGAQITRVTVKDGAKIVANEGYAISGVGNDHGTEILIEGGDISSTEQTAIYHPQDGVLTLAGGKITGKVGVQMCAGDLMVPADSTVVVVATGSDDRADKKENDGPILDGAAISIVDRSYPGGTPTANIKGGTFKSEKGEALLDYAWGDKTASEWVDAGEFIDVSGGAFSNEVSEDLLAEGFGNNLEKGEDGLYHVHKHDWAGKFESSEKGHWHVCSKCDETSEVVAHVEKTVGAKPATCGEDGYTGDLVCADCGYVIEKGAVIPATGKHTAGDTWKSDGTSHWHECTDCGTKLDEAKHTSSKWTVNDTDHWHLCDVCGAPHDVAPHDFGAWTVTEDATATEAGSREHTCKTCGKVVVEAIPALGSKPGDKPGEGDKLVQTGDVSLLGAAAAGIAGISTAVAGVFASRRRRNEE